MKARDLTGNKFHRLTVTGPHASRGFWLADCDCGTKAKIVRGSSLMSGNTKSCGCLLYENPGRKKAVHNVPFIDFDDMLMSTIEHIGPIRHYMKAKGVTVTKDSMVYIAGKKFGPFNSPFHALAFAINKTVKGMGEK